MYEYSGQVLTITVYFRMPESPRYTARDGLQSVRPAACGDPKERPDMADGHVGYAHI